MSKHFFGYKLVESQIFANTPGEIIAATLYVSNGSAALVKLFNGEDNTASTQFGLLSVPAGTTFDRLHIRAHQSFHKMYVEFTSGSGELILYVRDPGVWALSESVTGYGLGGFGAGGFG